MVETWFYEKYLFFEMVVCRTSWTLDAWSGRLDSGRLDPWTLDPWITNYLLATTRLQPRRYYNWKLWFLHWNLLQRIYICNCSLIIEKQPFNRWMTATVVAKLTQNL